MAKKQQDEPCKEQEERIAELENSLARTQADYANFRRRTEEQADAWKRRAAKDIISDVLAIVDHLELALKDAPKGEFTTGVEMIFGQLISVLEEHGAARIPTESFDPSRHEAVLSEHAKTPKGTIIDVLQHGWELEGEVLRTAKVKVSLGKEESK